MIIVEKRKTEDIHAKINETDQRKLSTLDATWSDHDCIPRWAGG
jgi:hypothetical protein